MIVTVFNSYCQQVAPHMVDKNTFDLQCLGNKGFFAIGYSRMIFEKKNLCFNVSPAIGLVPGSHEDSLSSIPSFTHLNIGLNLVYGRLKYGLDIGTSYSKILVGNRYHERPKSNYNRVLGELGIIRYLPADRLAIRLAFNPILYDDGATDVSNIPVSVTFQIGL